MSALRSWLRRERAAEHLAAQAHVYDIVDRNGFQPRRSHWMAKPMGELPFWEDDPEMFGVPASVLLPLIREPDRPPEPEGWYVSWVFSP